MWWRRLHYWVGHPLRLLATSTLHYWPLGFLALRMCLSANSSRCPRRMTAGIVPAVDFFHVERGVVLPSHGRTWWHAGDAWCDSSVQFSGQRFRSGRILESDGSNARERGCAEGNLLTHYLLHLQVVASTAAYSCRGAEPPPHPPGEAGNSRQSQLEPIFVVSNNQFYPLKVNSTLTKLEISPRADERGALPVASIAKMHRM